MVLMNSKVRVQLSVMMFLQFFVWGAWFVTLSSYLTDIGFEGLFVGRAYLMNNIAAIISPFFVGMIADRFFNSEKLMGFLHLLGGVVMFRATGITEVGPLIGVLLLYNVCYMPTLALVNAISFNQMQNPDKEFPGIRVWGTLGWIVAGLTILLIQTFFFEGVETSNIPMKMAAGVSILLGLFSFSLPNTPPKMAGEKVSVGDVLGLKALRLMKDWSFALFVICSFLISIPLAFYYNFTNVFLNESEMTGVAGKMTMGQMSEVIFMILMPFFFARLGVKKMLLFGMLAWVIRYVLFALGNNEALVWMYYIGILLHGICYDFFFVTGQIYVDRKAGKEIRASAQGLFALITYGLGIGVGSEVSGRIVSAYTVNGVKDWPSIWWVPAVFALVIVIFFALSFKDKQEVDSSL
jgi:nucleoside transporter